MAGRLFEAFFGGRSWPVSRFFLDLHAAELVRKIVVLFVLSGVALFGLGQELLDLLLDGGLPLGSPLHEDLLLLFGPKLDGKVFPFCKVS